MKVCLIGSLSGAPDEGYRNVTGRLARHLAASHEVLPLDGGRPIPSGSGTAS